MSQWLHGVHKQRRLDSKGGGSMECLVIPDSVLFRGGVRSSYNFEGLFVLFCGMDVYRTG